MFVYEDSTPLNDADYAVQFNLWYADKTILQRRGGVGELVLYKEGGRDMNKRGRPNKITEDIVHKLEEAFLKGLSDREACIYASIAPSTFYDYCSKHKDFSERKELLKENLKMKAKINLAESIEDGNITQSIWYLERKCKDEFSQKQEVELSGNNPFSSLSTEELKKLVESG